MKKHIPTLLTIVACVMVFLCMGEISSLQNQVFQMHSEISQLRNDMTGITNNIQQAMEEEASLVSYQDWTFGEMDDETLTIPFTYTVAPKQMTPGATTAALVTDDGTYDMTDNGNGSFSVTLDLPAFEEFHTKQVTFITNGVQTSEYFEMYDTPFFHTKDLPYASYGGSTYQEESKLRYEGNITLDNCHGNMKFSAQLVQLSGDEEVGREPIQWTNHDYFFGDAEVSGSIPYSQDGKASLWVEVTDDNGLVYRLPALIEELDANGEPSFAVEEPPKQVYDPQGNLLWEGYY